MYFWISIYPCHIRLCTRMAFELSSFQSDIMSAISWSGISLGYTFMTKCPFLCSRYKVTIVLRNELQLRYAYPSALGPNSHNKVSQRAYNGPSKAHSTPHLRESAIDSSALCWDSIPKHYKPTISIMELRSKSLIMFITNWNQIFLPFIWIHMAPPRRHKFSLLIMF